jgi:hypothetical protein
VAVPAEAAFDFFAFHGLIARYDVFDGAWDEMPEVRKSGSEWGAVVKDELLRVFALFKGFLEYIVLFPEFKDFFFQLGEIYF